MEKYAESIILHLQQILIPYSLDHIDLQAMRFFKRKSVNDPFFKNFVILYYSDIDIYSRALNETYKLCKKVKREIEDELL